MTFMAEAAYLDQRLRPFTLSPLPPVRRPAMLGVMPAPRVAYFPDSFHEVNGVAHTSRHFLAFAERQGLPLLCVRPGVA